MPYPSLPPLPRNIGDKRTITSIHGRPVRLKLLDEIRVRQSTNPRKAIYLQRLRFEKDDRIELRFAYYIIGVKGRTKGKWVWGQRETMMPAKDFQAIVKKAIRKRWIKPIAIDT